MDTAVGLVETYLHANGYLTVTEYPLVEITQGKTTLAPTALKAGTRIVAEGTENKGTVTATTVQIGTAPVTAR